MAEAKGELESWPQAAKQVSRWSLAKVCIGSLEKGPGRGGGPEKLVVEFRHVFKAQILLFHPIEPHTYQTLKPLQRCSATFLIALIVQEDSYTVKGRLYMLVPLGRATLQP